MFLNSWRSLTHQLLCMPDFWVATFRGTTGFFFCIMHSASAVRSRSASSELYLGGSCLYQLNEPWGLANIRARIRTLHDYVHSRSLQEFPIPLSILVATPIDWFYTKMRLPIPPPDTARLSGLSAWLSLCHRHLLPRMFVCLATIWVGP